jgi:3-methyladenine DNA glycosylase AlkC
MAERLKDMFFTRESITRFTEAVRKVYPEFDEPRFVTLVFDETFAAKELMARMSHTTRCLKQVLPEAYAEAAEILKKAAPRVKGFEALCLPDYVAQFGLDDWELSLSTLESIGRYITGELAIRPFLDRDPTKVIPYLLAWAEDPNVHLRRLASEGSRPRLPWAMALPKFKKDPSPILPILEKLKDDASEDVRRSVANHLNDISKDNPDLALKVCSRWFGRSENTDRIVKHACRTLLKAGHPQALRIFGYSDPSDMCIRNFDLSAETIAIGDDLRFSFDLHLVRPGKVRLEYVIRYVKAKGKLSSKVFKLTENTYSDGVYSFKRKHAFADMSTRTHYPGTHHIAIHINGQEKAKASLELVSP